VSQITKSRRSADCKHVGFYHGTSLKYAVLRFIYTHDLKRIISMLSIYMLTLRRGRCNMVLLLLHTKPQMITSQQHTLILPYTCFLILMVLKLVLNRLSSLAKCLPIFPTHYTTSSLLSNTTYTELSLENLLLFAVLYTGR